MTVPIAKAVGDTNAKTNGMITLKGEMHFRTVRVCLINKLDGSPVPLFRLSFKFSEKNPEKGIRELEG